MLLSVNERYYYQMIEVEKTEKCIVTKLTPFYQNSDNGVDASVFCNHKFSASSIINKCLISNELNSSNS